MSAVSSALTCPQVFEVLVVDNASHDGSVEGVASLGDDRIRLLVNETNVGFGRAANRGAAAATGEVLIFLNSDAVLSPEACDALISELERYGWRAIVGPRLESPDGELQRSAGLRPAPLDLALRALGLHRLGRWLVGVSLVGRLIAASGVAREYETAKRARTPVDTSMVSGACLAIGQAAFREIGGFDERFFMYFEDADLCRRALAARMPVRFVPDAVVVHVGGGSSSEDYHFGPLHARSMRQYLAKWWGRPGSLIALAVLTLRAGALTVTNARHARRARQALVAAARRG